MRNELFLIGGSSLQIRNWLFLMKGSQTQMLHLRGRFKNIHGAVESDLAQPQAFRGRRYIFSVHRITELTPRAPVPAWWAEEGQVSATKDFRERFRRISK
jgi:hypothetical protein